MHEKVIFICSFVCIIMLTGCASIPDNGSGTSDTGEVFTELREEAAASTAQSGELAARLEGSAEQSGEIITILEGSADDIAAIRQVIQTVRARGPIQNPGTADKN